MQNILLLDIENQPKKVRELNFLLKQYSQVIVVYANSNLNIALDDLMELSLAIQDKRLLIIKMPKTGANSADFGLTFIAGRLSAQLEKGSSIDVMSNDTAMSYAVELLGQIGIQSTHIKQLAEPVKIEQSQLAVQEIKIKPKPQIEVNVDKKVLQLLAKNQPKKPKSLLKSLMSWCNLNLQQAEILLEKLQQIKVVVIEQNKCEYNKKELKKALGQGNLNTTSPRLTMTEIELRPHLMRIKQYCDYLSKVTNNKPSKIDTLSNSIKALFKFEKDEHVQQMINLLKKHQIIQLNAQKIVYLQSNIDIWSTIK
ncbi:MULTISPECIES: PIN domain-containing protein [unclassified Acinetobacter]|uniref:PIN domain-containing protein n=1 Tax=unclassified Acinetobacter TaxID=196816 RepID=UPI00244A370D|nr:MULTISPECIES: PIN domain-containing protein [unclassified Acinetobacter]MDH0031084.1 PIN domain-containing protein [Acinetobacter sp. GD04021]MDH0886670.1 PIN domain-containing protein [Acinetobacter sp. GD03873]MDH1083197.1 PIN domain-containing protein [Acinetobacter sp. GD03983]MDH2189290.1 PIN domain-containing protein [Acinetobacter sp. GD03645]MDH2202903.1 PIN domain-containing protein [Acinetobacter sp. GD03647]